MMAFRIAVLALFSCVLSACGGGGGGGGGGAGQPPAGTEFRVTLDRTALTFQATEGSTPPSQAIVATWTGTPPDPVYISATVEGTGIAPTIPTLVTASSATATVSVASGLVAGNYTGRINFLVCRDAACTQRVGGSPLPVNFTVNVAAAAVSSTPISFDYVAGNSLPAPQKVQVASSAGTWSVTTSATWLHVSPASGQGAGSFDVSFDPAFAAPGTQSATITVHSATGIQTIPVSLTFTSPTSGGGNGGGGVTGDFTLSTNTVAFTARRSGPAPASYSVQLHLADTQPVGVGAAFATSVPDWVGVSLSGQAPNYTLTLNVTNTNKAIGTYSAVLVVGTVDSAHNVLKTQNVTVTLRVIDTVRAFVLPMPSPFVLGSSASSGSTDINVLADSTTSWTVASNAPWASTSVANGTGNATLTLEIDAANLDIGTHTGNVTIVNAADPTNVVTLPVTATVVAPTISIAAGPVVIGGTDGLGTDRTETFALNINTGTNSFPWTAPATTANGDAWLTLPAASGQVSSTTINITVDGDASLVEPGSHDGAVTVQVNVRGHTYSRSMPVVLNKEGHWLQASAHGAAFSSFPSRSVLSRSVQITSTLGRTDVPWSATSNASWLSVTTSGTTGGTLQLTVDPTGLQQDTTHIATVTIASSDPDILNQENIRVAFWASATDPQDVRVNGWQPLIVTNPVEPWVYTNGSGSYADSTIRVYNVYTGALVHSWTTTLATIADLAISQDGTLLFVNDWASRSVVALDARTGATVRSYPYNPNFTPVGVVHIDAGSRPILAIGSGEIFDVASGTRHSGVLPADRYLERLSFAVDPLNRHLYAQDQGVSNSTLTQLDIKRTALIEDGIVITRAAEASGGSNGLDVCVSGDSARVYTANGFPYEFTVFAADPLRFTTRLAAHPYTGNAECGWNGIFVGGAESFGDPENVWIYRPDGSLVTALSIGQTLTVYTAPESLALSGDNTRLIGAVSENGIVNPTGVVFKSIPAP